MQSLLANQDQKSNSPQPGFLRRWLQSKIHNWKHRKMVAALQAMDDRLLWELGIRRTEIVRVVDSFDERELGMVPLAQLPSPDRGQQSALKLAA